MPLADVGEQHPLPVADIAEDEIAKLVQGATVSAAQRAVSSTTPLAERTNTFQEVDLGLTEEQARSEAQRCLQCGGCAECGLCIDVCDPKCIDLDMAERAEDLEVGAIVLATGFEPFDPSVLTPYGYGEYKNVITSLEFERLISASGPTQGRLLRPSDGKPAKQLAFIQCVGSRDLRHHQYCSSVCCMFATQEAIVANTRDPEVCSTIFYRDMRAAGKGFQDPLTALNDDQSVSYIRARVAEISLVGDDRLLLSYDDIESAGAGARTVDMVVLVVGLAPRRGAQELASVLGIELDEHSFVRTHPFSPTDTTREGVFACGFCRGPADISEAVAQASAAAARAAEVVVTTYAEMRG